SARRNVECRIFKLQAAKGDPEMGALEAKLPSYSEVHARSIGDREAFWSEQAEQIDWHRPFEQVLAYSNPPFTRWFVGGQTILCHNAIDRHLAERRDAPALIYVSTETGAERSYSFGELHDEVVRMAAVMRSLGVRRGDRVLIYMPM